MFTILNNGCDMDMTNYTDIVLILKLPNPSNMVDFRPISLCSDSYKIVAKSIANCIQAVMDKCIDLSRCAFVPGRLITGNMLLALELMHGLRQKQLGKKGYIALKVDMSKTYDRVEWVFRESHGPNGF